MAEIVIFSTPICGHCKRAKELLEQMGIEYTEHNIYEDRVALDIMRDNGFKTVPQIAIDGKWIGGYEDLVRMKNSGKLNR